MTWQGGAIAGVLGGVRAQRVGGDAESAAAGGHVHGVETDLRLGGDEFVMALGGVYIVSQFLRNSIGVMPRCSATDSR